MKKFYLTIIPILFLGCGGGGGSSQPIPSAPITTPSAPIVNTPITQTPVVQANWLTQEYLANTGNNIIKAKGAYENGYTGQGVVVAVLDSGVDLDHRDLKKNIVTGRSFAAYTYDTSSGNFYYTENGIGSDSVESIELSQNGTTYSVAPTITINGNGVGAKAIALLNTNGTLKGIYMTANGSGYTEANVTISGGAGIEVSRVRFGSDDDDGHGSAIAGIIASEKTQWNITDSYDYSTHGVAFNANIMSVKVFDNQNYVSIYSLQKGIEYAANNNAKIINMSIGSNYSNSFSGLEDSFTYALSKNSTFVISAGNEGLDCKPINGSIQGRCSFPAALPWVSGNEPLLNGNGGWVVVGSINKDKVLSTFSNKAGITKSNYLVAPGEEIQSTYRDGMGVYMSGTSISAPFVSGAMALMYEKYPHLNGNQLSQIFFSTATDLGELGIDDIYGNGLINIEKAFMPIGELSIPNKDSNLTSFTSLDKTHLRLSSVFGDKLIKQKGLNNAIALDFYQRDFNINLTSVITSDLNRFSFNDFSVMKFDNLLIGFNQNTQKIMAGINIENSNLMFSYDNSIFGSSGAGGLDLTGNTIYVSYSQKLPVKDFISFKYQLDYGLSISNKDSLITDISSIHAIGGSLLLDYNGLGLIYELPMAIQSGNMNLSIPVSREINGVVNYQDINTDLAVSDREQKYGFYYQNLNNLLSFHFIENIGNAKSERIETAIKLHTNISF